MEVSREHSRHFGGSVAPGEVSPTDTVPVPRSLLTRLWLALGWAGFFMLAAAVQGALRPGYDSWHQAVSALSLGPFGWIQGVNFVVLGVALLSTVPVWRRMLAGGKGAGSYPALTAGTGMSFIVVAFVPQDPAPGYDPMQLGLAEPTPIGLLHLALAGVAAGCSVAGLFVMAYRFAGDHHWAGWASYSRVMAAMMVVFVATYGVWSTSASGFAGTFERLAILIPSVWGLAFVRRLSTGAPFMVAVAPAPGEGVSGLVVPGRNLPPRETP